MQPSTSTVSELPLPSQVSEGINQLNQHDQDRTVEWVLNTLQHVPDAVWGAQSRKECMEDTRVNILNELISWSEDTEQPALCWLTGTAGTGKSAISGSFCQKLQDAGRLGGSFFCSRKGPTCDARRVIPTLGNLLARQVEAFRLALVEEAKKTPDVIRKLIAVQFECLLLQPLSSLTLPNDLPYVLVIDGLDECTDREVTVDLIEQLVTFATRLPAIKIFITSGSEYFISSTHLSTNELSRIIRLHELARSEVDLDIAIYFHERLCHIPSFSNAIRDTLVRLTDGLFIFASTAVAYICDDNSAERLEKLTHLENVISSSAKSLDALYKLILDEAASPEHGEPQERDDLKEILAVIIALRSPLSISALAEILEKPAENLRGILSRFRAVINVPREDSEPGLNALHAMFEDFLVDHSRSRDDYLINESDGHAKLMSGCFTTMHSHAYAPTGRSSYFSSSVSPSRGSHALMYAALHWPHHYAQAPILPFTELEGAMRLIVRAFYRRSSGAYTGDLDCAIASQQGLVKYMPKDHPKMAGRVAELGYFVQLRFERLGFAGDLEAMIEAHRRAYELSPDGEPSKTLYLSRLGKSLYVRFERLGTIDDLEAAIDALRRTVELNPDNRWEKSAVLRSLGTALRARFERLGIVGDLEAATEALRYADELNPPLSTKGVRPGENVKPILSRDK